MKLLSPLALLLSLTAFACSSASDETGTETGGGSCQAGAPQDCPCTDGSLGTQVCAADGQSFGVCSCPSGAPPVNPNVTPVGMDPMDPMGMDPTDPIPVDPVDPTDPVIQPTDPEIVAYDEKYACNLSTGWAGDELCIMPPDPSEGFMLHHGPSDYDNPDDIANFTLLPGGEENVEVGMVTGNTTDILYKEYHIRMRPGTHHMILWGNDATGIAAIAGRYIFGAQGALDGGHEDRPGDDVAPENENVGYTMAANTPVGFEMHYVNTSTEPMLREGWINIHYADPADITEIADPIAFFGALNLNIPAQSTQLVGATATAPSVPVRAISLSGHMHAHGERFSAWHITADGQRSLVYETYDWAEPAALVYDTIHQNPTPDPATYSDGGHTGILSINPGDSIQYECEMVNDTDSTLRFGNQTYEAEMCLLFGSYAPSVGGQWSIVSF